MRAPSLSMRSATPRSTTPAHSCCCLSPPPTTAGRSPSPATGSTIYWGRFLPNETTVLSLLDRLLHHHRLVGFTNTQLVGRVSPLLEDLSYSSRQATSDLRRLKRKGVIARVEGTQRYQLTAVGRRIATWFSKAHGRVLTPGPPGPIVPYPLTSPAAAPSPSPGEPSTAPSTSSSPPDGRCATTSASYRDGPE